MLKDPLTLIMWVWSLIVFFVLLILPTMEFYRIFANKRKAAKDLLHPPKGQG